MAIKAHATTAEDLWNLPDEGLRHELVAGELRMMAPPGAEHGRIAATVGGLLFAHVRQNGIGVAFAAETGFLLSRNPDTVRAPDAAFVGSARADAVGRTEKYWPGAPDFAAEVISPDDSAPEVEAKALAWLAAGTRIVLVLDPARQTANSYHRGADMRSYRDEETVDLSDAVPGWRVSVAEFFR